MFETSRELCFIRPHFPLFLGQIPRKNRRVPTLIYDYKKADFTFMNVHLANIDWSITLGTKPTVDEASVFPSLFYLGWFRTTFCPNSLLTTSKSETSLHIKKIIKYRKQLWADVQYKREVRLKFVYVTKRLITNWRSFIVLGKKGSWTATLQQSSHT